MQSWHLRENLLKKHFLFIYSSLLNDLSVCIYIYIYIYWLSVVESNPKLPFSLRCRSGRFPFLWIGPLTLDSYLIILILKEWVIKYHFLHLWYDSIWDWTPVLQAISKHSIIFHHLMLVELSKFQMMIVFFQIVMSK